MPGDLVEQWREVGSALWLVAIAAVLAWLALYAALAARTEPRRVEPGRATLDLGGPETPAVVNLIAGDWDLGPEAVSATLLDLAARGRLAVEQVGDRTVVRVPHWGEDGDDDLARYERMVLDHVTALSRHTDDRVVPAEALTTGPGDGARHWWRRFRAHVHRDARARGLSRARWSTGHRLVLAGGAWSRRPASPWPPRRRGPRAATPRST